MNWFWCQLAQVVHGARPWTGQLCGSGGQRSRSHKAKVRYGCLAEASLSTPLGQVALLVLINLCCYIDIFATKAIFCWNLCFFQAEQCSWCVHLWQARSECCRIWFQRFQHISAVGCVDGLRLEPECIAVSVQVILVIVSKIHFHLRVLCSQERSCMMWSQIVLCCVFQ